MSLTKNEKKRRFLSLTLAGLIAAGLILVASFYLFQSRQVPEQSNVKAAQTEAVKGGAGGPGTPAYNEKLGKYDDEQSNKALQAGESYVSVPIGKSKPLIEPKKDTPAPPPSPAPVRVAPPAAHYKPPSKQVDDPMLRVMMDDLSSMNARLGSYAGTGAIVFNQEFPKEAAEISASTPAAAGKEQDPAIGLRPGDLLYAVLDTGVNSDVPSAVMATIATGFAHLTC